MAAPLNDDSKVMFKLLQDRGWHNYDEIVNAIAAKVPPGRAMRRFEQSVRLSPRGKADPGWRGDPELDDASRIEAGARKCAYAAVSNWNRQGALDLKGYRESKEVRVKPEWSSTQVPGYEHPAEGQDPGLGAEGSPEVPRGDSDRSEVEYSVRKALTGEGLDSGELPEVVREDERWVPKELEEEILPDDAGDYAWPSVTLEALAQCESCGLAISNQALHDQWHAEQDGSSSSPDVALLNESQVSDLIRVVVRQELDKFQSGLEYWLSSRFLQLEASIGAAAGTSGRWNNPDVWRPQR